MSNPLVSVITTVYNRASFIKDCITSVQQSKFTDYEHIIVDDNSTDDSMLIAQQFAEGDKRIKIWENETNIGDYPNRNRGASHAIGKYLKYVDADDMLGPWALNLMVDCMEQYPSAALGLFAHGHGSSHVPILLTPDEAYDAHYNRGITIFNRSPLGAIMQRNRFETIGGFPENQHVGDCELWHRLAAVFPVVVLPSELSHYRVHDDQQSVDNRTNVSVPFKYFDAALRGMSLGKISQISEPKFAEIEKKIKRKQARTILVFLRRAKFLTARRLQKQSRRSWGELFKNARL